MQIHCNKANSDLDIGTCLMEQDCRIVAAQIQGQDLEAQEGCGSC